MELLSTNKKLMKEWDYEKNNIIGINPDKLTFGSNKKVWWKCENNHSWQAPINRRAIRGHNCPYCSGRYAVSGKNDLASMNSNILIDWNYQRNNIDPSNLKSGSHYLAYWKCHVCGGEWQAPIYNRVKGNGCPFCSNKKVLSGYNDLETKYPEIALEWNFLKNNDLLPNMVIPGSDRKVWWKCPICDYEWQATITSRVNQGTGCPNCFKYWGTSFPEQALLFYLKKSYDEIKNRYILNNAEIDIYIPEENIGIEYDGFQWHKNSLKNDNKKDNIFKNKIKLIRIRENGLSKTDSAINIFRENRSTNDLENTINKIFKYLKKQAPVLNIHDDRNKIIANYITTKNNISLSKINPTLSKEWNFEKNKPLTPSMVAANCNEKVWWICSKCGYEWESIIASRNKGIGCPKCADKTRQKTRRNNLIKKGNSLSEKRPDLLKEWNYKRNSNINPDNIPYGSGTKVWWICSNCGSEWQATINVRTNIGAGCPYCAGKKVMENKNDLVTLYPSLIKEWDYRKNDKINLFPNKLTRGSAKKAWWICSNCGNNWQATINHRTIRGHGCPKCHNKIND